MTAEERREIIVGLVASLALFAILALVQAHGAQLRSHDDDTYPVVATFNRVDGIAVGAPVRVGGVFVGRVADLELMPDFRVKMTMAIDRNIALPADSAVSIQTDGLFGPKTVRIEPGGDEATLPSGGQIHYAQDPLLVSDVLDLIIAEGRAQRAAAPAEAR